eukprot:9836561-Alexandrium_andersonii.AAC.1
MSASLVGSEMCIRDRPPFLLIRMLRLVVADAVISQQTRGRPLPNPSFLLSNWKSQTRRPALPVRTHSLGERL